MVTAPSSKTEEALDTMSGAYLWGRKLLLLALGSKTLAKCVSLGGVSQVRSLVWRKGQIVARVG